MARVLLVEDNDLVGELLSREINAEGHRVHWVSIRAEAESALRTDKYDLLICDIRLPDGSGRSLIKQAAELGTRCVAIGGYPPDLYDQSDGRPWDACLLKPFRLDDLRNAIRQALDSSTTPRFDEAPQSLALSVVQTHSEQECPK